MSTAAPTLRPRRRRDSRGDLGSGSDFTAFLQHVGIPSTDIARTALTAFITPSLTTTPGTLQNADPNSSICRKWARVFGLEALRMADADVLPYDYVAYAAAISSYIEAAKKKASDQGLSLDLCRSSGCRPRFFRRCSARSRPPGRRLR